MNREIAKNALKKLIRHTTERMKRDRNHDSNKTTKIKMRLCHRLYWADICVNYLKNMYFFLFFVKPNTVITNWYGGKESRSWLSNEIESILADVILFYFSFSALIFLLFLFVLPLVTCAHTPHITHMCNGETRSRSCASHTPEVARACT